MDIKKETKKIRAALCENGTPTRAEKEKAYLKSPFEFYGVTVPFCDRLAKGVKKEHPDASRGEVFGLVRELWETQNHNEKTTGLKILSQYHSYLDMEAMPMLERMLMQSTGWDHVDGIATHLISEVLKKDKKACDYLRRWSASDNFWMRRASLISQILLFRKGGGDKKLFMGFARNMVSEKEFFIRKALGWTIRELSKHSPDDAFEMLAELKSLGASGLTLREGAKRLPEKLRKKIAGR